MGYTSDGVAGKPNNEMRVELETRNTWQLFPPLDLKKQKKPKAQDNLVEAGTMVSLSTELEPKGRTKTTKLPVESFPGSHFSFFPG